MLVLNQSKAQEKKTTPKDELESFLKETVLNSLKLKIELLSLKKTDLDLDISLLEPAKIFLDLLGKQSIKGGQKSRDDFYKVSQRIHAFSRLVSKPEYSKEIVPLILSRINGYPLPTGANKVPQRIIEASNNGKIGLMVKEAKKILDEEKVLLEKKGVALVAQIEFLQKEVEKIMAPKKAPPKK